MLIAVTTTLTPAAARRDDGFITSQPAMLRTSANVPNGLAMPIITVGDVLASGYKYEAIPDGIDFVRKGNTVEVCLARDIAGALSGGQRQRRRAFGF